MTNESGQSSIGSSPSSAKFDPKRLSKTDRIVSIATLILFISLFLTWFGVSAGIYGSVGASGESVHGYLWIVAILSLVILAYYVMVATFETLPFKLPVAPKQFLIVAVTINLVLTLIAFLFKPSGLGVVHVGWRFGAFIGLIAAIVAAAPILMPVIQSRRTAAA